MIRATPFVSQFTVYSSLSQESFCDVPAELYQLVDFGGLGAEGEGAPEGEGAAPFVGFFE